jgi:hypothetical protein
MLASPALPAAESWADPADLFGTAVNLLTFHFFLDAFS